MSFFHLTIPIVFTQNPLFSSHPQAAQALPTDLSRIDEVEARGTMIGAAKERLQLAKNKIDSLIQKASGILKEKINDAKKQAVDLMENLKNGALKATDKIYGSLQMILDKVSRLEDMVKYEAEMAANYEAETVQSRKIE